MSEPEEFTEAPEEVTRYFDAKKSQPSYDWRDVAPYEHATQFTVAKSAGYDVLDDIRAAVSEARRTYQDFGTFADGLEPLLRRKGWWGQQKHPETGEIVKLGSLHRLRTIYWANMSTARAAGEWERTWRTRRALPFLIYELSTAETKRLLHQGWVGTILPVGHAWWRTHYPPNGWLCQCRVRQISKFEAQRRGYDPEAEAPAIETYKWTNKRTGEVVYVPKGIDAGWQGNPGLHRAENAQALLSGRIAQMTEAQQATAIEDLTGSRMFRAIQSNELGYDPARGGDQLQRELGRIAAPVATLPDEVGRLIGLAPDAPPIIQFSVADAAKQIGKGERAHFTPDLYGTVQRMLISGEVFQDTNGPATFIFRALIEDHPYVAVVQLTGTRRGAFLKSFRRTDGRDKAKWKRLR